MNIGFRYGPEVLAFVVDQALHGNEVPSEADLLKEARRWLLVRAQAKALVGGLSSKDPEFDLVKVLSQQEAKANVKYQHQTQDDRMGFARISASEACQLVIRQVTQQGALEKMNFALQSAAQLAAAKKDVTKADRVVGVGDKDSL